MGHDCRLPVATRRECGSKVVSGKRAGGPVYLCVGVMEWAKFVRAGSTISTPLVLLGGDVENGVVYEERLSRRDCQYVANLDMQMKDAGFNIDIDVDCECGCACHAESIVGGEATEGPTSRRW